MRSKPLAFLRADLGVTKTHSRPHVSDDNPYSESQFRTMKYRPEFPDRFGCIQDSRAFSQGFFRWYNEEHYHSGLALLTPAMVHYQQTGPILQQRQQVLDVAYQLHPERFVRQAPKPAAVPTEVWINKPPSLEIKACAGEHCSGAGGLCAVGTGLSSPSRPFSYRFHYVPCCFL
jgi:putative transposase